MRKLLVLGFALAALLPFSGGQPAHAAAFTVTKTADTNDGVCDADCSLREAIGAANALPGADSITLPAGTYTLNIPGAGEDANSTGDLDITADLTLTGAGAATTIIDGAALDRVFHIVRWGSLGSTVEISGVTVRNGSADAGGGILNQGTLALDSSTVSGNTAYWGGGLLNEYWHNTYPSSATLTNVTFSGNTAHSGGGMYNSYYTSATLTNVTFSGNSAPLQGGGMYNDPGSSATLANVTFSGNTAYSGGGMYSWGGSSTLTNVTFSGNTGGGMANRATSSTLKNTIVANNIPNDCAGSITSLGHNLIEAAACTIAGDTTGNIIGVDPLLGALADNGGPTQTHALLADSPAIDAGSPDCPPPATDQRGVARPQGPACDIGAFERPPVEGAPARPVITDTDPDSPGNDNSPKVKGNAEANSTVRLYTTSDCTGSAVATGSATTFSSPGLQVSVADESSTTFRATATDSASNVSSCSWSSLTYVEDSTPPAQPTLTDTDPDSPANHNSPKVKGYAEANSTVRLYTTSDCSGSAVATGSATTFSSPGLQVSVADDSSTTLRATATDPAGNVSPCSWSSVTYTEDQTLPNIEDELRADGDCSLREAIQAANTDAAVDACPAGSGADTITLPAGTYTLNIPGAGEDANASGDLDITADLTINGAGAGATIIDGAALDRVFHIVERNRRVGATVEISGVTIRNGSADNAGGILNGGTLALDSSAVSGNSAYSGGGGLLNGTTEGSLASSATLTNVTFSDNTAHVGGGMVNAYYTSSTLTNVTFSGNSSGFQGGGMFNDPYSSSTLTNVTFSGNSSQDGGGMYNYGSTSTLTNVTFSGNTGDTGGLSNSHYSTATLTNVTFSGNHGTYGGGGMFNGRSSSSTLTNVTFSGNSAYRYGGGMFNDGSGSATLTNVTFSGNGLQVPSGSGGGIMDGGGTTLKNTILANNSPNDCAGSITSAGHNLIEAAACTIAGDTTDNIIGVDPLLGPLADNGGSTQTHAPLAGSPAIDAGSPDCPPPATDQRGVARPQGAACDIGAFELEAPAYDFSGFFRPVDNIPTLNLAKAGSAIPVKFSLSGNQGLSIFATAYPKWQKINCDTSVPLDIIEETVTAGSSSLSYDPIADQYVYVWKTDRAWAGTCRQLIVRLNDGADHVANFKFK